MRRTYPGSFNRTNIHSFLRYAVLICQLFCDIFSLAAWTLFFLGHLQGMHAKKLFHTSLNKRDQILPSEDYLFLKWVVPFLSSPKFNPLLTVSILLGRFLESTKSFQLLYGFTGKFLICFALPFTGTSTCHSGGSLVCVLAHKSKIVFETHGYVRSLFISKLKVDKWTSGPFSTECKSI